MVEFLSIRKTATATSLPERRLRLMHAQGRLPGIQTGNRFLVNVPLLREQLDAESRANVKKDPAGGDAA